MICKSRKTVIIEVNGSIQGDEAIYLVKDYGVGFDIRYTGKLFGVYLNLSTPFFKTFFPFVFTTENDSSFLFFPSYPITSSFSPGIEG